MLNDYDSRSSEVFDLNSACLSHAFGARAHQLGEQIASFAFDEALNTVRTLVTETSPQTF
jgi:conjugal transfer/entry exclusion protein